MTLHDTAGRLGAHQWSEQAVWTLLGRWAPSAGNAAAAILLDTHAQHAAWRARQWWDRLPVLAAIERQALIRPPTPAMGAVVDRLEVDPPEGTVAILATAYRVLLPRLVAGYAREAALLSTVSEGPARRTLAQVEADAATDWRAGEALLQDLLVGAGPVGEAAATVSAMEVTLAAGHPAGEAVQ